MSPVLIATVGLKHWSPVKVVNKGLDVVWTLKAKKGASEDTN